MKLNKINPSTALRIDTEPRSRRGRSIKNYFWVGCAVFIAFSAVSCSQPAQTDHRHDDGIIQEAYQNHRSKIFVESSGTVIRLLQDDEEAPRHQRFIVRLDNGQTLLIAHNIDIAPRIDDLQTGEQIKFRGEYEYNDKGGVIHWTHHDPSAQTLGGWLEYRGKKYY